LNFDTPELRVIGSCDIYTTKAAGGDKKLYKNIEHSLESQYESLLRFSASLSPPQATNAAAALNLSRASPFGPLSQISARREFAYLIATLNASHPDYDISNRLRPSDFRREKSLRLVMNTLDSTLQNLRPKPLLNSSSGPSHWAASNTSAGAPSPGISWNPKMWRAIDKEMSLRDCNIYSYSPEDDPYDDEEEPTLWALHYFFFNKARKRVCYFYIRGISVLDRDESVPRTPMSTRTTTDDSDWSGGFDSETGASKRARYWLGDRIDGQVHRVLGSNDDDDDVDELMADDEVDELRLLPATASRRSTFSTSDGASMDSEATEGRRSEGKGLDAAEEMAAAVAV
jgi:hypothetical protein